MIVRKFGGSSLSCPECFARAAAIVLDRQHEEPCTVVVSASGKTTDMLLRAGAWAREHNDQYKEVFREIENHHFALVRALFTVRDQSRLIAGVRLLLNEAQELAGGIRVTGDFTDKSRDKLLGYGELLSANLMNEYLTMKGMTTTLADARAMIRTLRRNGMTGVDTRTTDTLIRKTLKPDRHYVVPGFIATGEEGAPSSLGRNGSDHTAALIAAALKASVLEIWTDVSGVMTADPSHVPQARTIESMTYEEAMELSTFGAKIIHPPALGPLLKHQIPVSIKNTFLPENPGTRIGPEATENGNPVKGISVLDPVALLTLSGSSMIGVPGIAGRFFRALSDRRINVVFITQASSEHSITAGISQASVTQAATAVDEEFSSEIALGKVNPVAVEQDLSIVAIVGNNMKRKVGLSGKTFAALGRNGVNVVAIAQGSTERNISVVISRHDVRKALNVLHETHFLSRIKRTHLFLVGTGNVGSELVGQIARQQKKIREEFLVELMICGIANSRKMILNPEGVPPKKALELLDKEGEQTNMRQFLDKMVSFNLRNSIFVDNTASSEIAGLYPEILGHSSSVIAANKIAFSGPLAGYLENKRLAREKNAGLLFEANVGAGLPVIKTINDLVQSGDQVTSIEAVLSGSLNFIFNNYDGTKTFASVVREAKALGYTEPDPRLDLAGEDVARKILILARESGIELEPGDVEKKSFVPRKCFDAPDAEAFIRTLEDEEPFFRNLYQKAKDEKGRLRYVAKYRKGKAITALEVCGEDHPFYQLEGKDNILLLHTQRYVDQPLLIRGAGAGAAVTASGVFSDIMRLAR